MNQEQPSADQAVADGLRCHQNGDSKAAESLYRRALEMDRTHPDAHHLLGLLFFSRGALKEARESVVTATEIRSDISIYFNNLSLICQAMKDIDGAVKSARRAVELAPQDPTALTTLGVAQQLAGDLNESVTCYQTALRINPAASQARLNLANAYLERDDLELAEKQFHQLRVDPNMQHPAAVGLAKTSLRAGNPEESVTLLEPLISEAGDDPTTALTLGEAYLKSGQSRDALKIIDDALAEHPGHLGLHNFRGHILRDLDHPLEALAEFETVLDHDPGHADAAVNFGLVHLALEHYEIGWRAYRARARQHAVQRRRPRLNIPDLGTESVDGMDLVVWTEQGLGDEVLQASLIPDLSARTASLTVLCSARLQTLFAQSFPTVRIADKAHPPFKASPDTRACPLLDTAGELRPTPSAFPKHLGYLVADQSEVESLKRRYRGLRAQEADMEHDHPYVIGLSWRSGNAEYGAANTIPLPEWHPVLNTVHESGRRAMFVALQYDASDADRAALSDTLRPYVFIDPAVNHLGNLDNVAAQVAACDLVITTSTTTVQLAGALGRPTWHLPATGLARGWYWTFDQDCTPWYPSVRQFQRLGGEDYRTQITDIAEALHALLDQDLTPA